MAKLIERLGYINIDIIGGDDDDNITTKFDKDISDSLMYHVLKKIVEELEQCDNVETDYDKL